MVARMERFPLVSPFRKIYGKPSYLFLILLLLTAFIVRLWPLELWHFWDETVYLQHSEVIFSGRSNFDEFHLRPPVLPILIAFGYLFHHHMFTASVIVSLLGTAGVLFTFLLGRELFDRKTALIAAVIMAFSPYVVKASHWIMTNVPALTFIMMSFYLALRGIKKDVGLLYVLSGFFFGVSILTRFTSLVLLFVIPFYLFAYRKPVKAHLFYAIGVSIPMVPYLIWSQLEYGFFLFPFIIARGAVSHGNESAFFYFERFSELFPLVVLIGLVVYVASRVVCFKNSVRSFGSLKTVLSKKFAKEDLTLVLWSVVFFAYVSITQHKEIRYLLPVALPVILLSARGCAPLFNVKNKILKTVFLFVLSVLFIASFSEAFVRLDEPFVSPLKTDALRASDFILARGSDLNFVYSNTNHPVHAYYTGMSVTGVQFMNDFYLNFPENMPHKGYFIFYPGFGKEPGVEWLESRPEFSRLKDLDTLVIYEYRPEGS